MQFGLFLALVGMLISIVASWGAEKLAMTGVTNLLHLLKSVLIGSAFPLLYQGTKEAVSEFMEADVDDLFGGKHKQN